MLIDTSDQRLRCHLEQYCSRLRQTEHSWAHSPFASKQQYQFHVRQAESAVNQFGHPPQQAPGTIWVAPVVSHPPALDLKSIEEESDDPEDPSLPSSDGNVESEDSADEEGGESGVESGDDADEDDPAPEVDSDFILQSQLAEDEVDGREDKPDPVLITIVWRAPVRIFVTTLPRWPLQLTTFPVSPVA